MTFSFLIKFNLINSAFIFEIIISNSGQIEIVWIH